MNRRNFIGRAGALVSLGAGAWMAPAGPAQAQDSGYRALVCVFLYGGNDGINMVPPADDAGWQRYASVRGNVALSRSSIVQLNATHALHPGLAPLKAVWDAGRLGLMFNVGPLARPLTQADYLAWRSRNDASLVPESLFSHSDQQILWQNGASVTSLVTGWGGRLSDAGGAGSVLSFAGNSRFGAGLANQELVLPGPGGALGLNGYWNGRQPNARKVALEALVNAPADNRLQARLASLQRSAFDTSARLGPILLQAPTPIGPDPANPEISAAFNHLQGDSGSSLARQLYQVAKMIKNRGAVGGARHVFFVSAGGYDTHAGQLGAHASLMAQLGTAVAAFYAATQQLGVANEVTLFTESDFGRTFKPNDSGGTDHAWGNQQLVVGGSVLGGKGYGVYPSLVLGGPDDAGTATWERQGRWIPSVSVDQYAATLAGWFAPGVQTAALLPNLANFPVKDLGFMARG